MKTQILTALITILASTNCFAKVMEGALLPMQLRTHAIECQYTRFSPQNAKVFQAQAHGEYGGDMAYAIFEVGGNTFATGTVIENTISIEILGQRMHFQANPGEVVEFVEPTSRMDKVACRYNYTVEQFIESFPKSFANASIDRATGKVFYGFKTLPLRNAWVQQTIGNLHDVPDFIQAPEGKIIVGIEMAGMPVPPNEKNLWANAPFQPEKLGQSSLRLNYKGNNPNNIIVHYADEY